MADSSRTSRQKLAKAITCPSELHTHEAKEDRVSALRATLQTTSEQGVGSTVGRSSSPGWGGSRRETNSDVTNAGARSAPDSLRAQQAEQHCKHCKQECKMPCMTPKLVELNTIDAGVEDTSAAVMWGLRCVTRTPSTCFASARSGSQYSGFASSQRIVAGCTMRRQEQTGRPWTRVSAASGAKTGLYLWQLVSFHAIQLDA